MSLQEDHINSEIFSISHRRLAATLILLYGSPALITISVLAFPALLAGIFLDLRWIVIFLMVIFLFTPMFLTFLYFFHGLRMSTSSNVVPHSLDITGSGIKVCLYDRVKMEEAEENEGKEKEEKRKVEGKNESKDKEQKFDYFYRSEKFYPVELFSDIKVASQGQLIQLRAPEKGFIWLSPEGFTSRDDYGKAIRLIRKLVENENTER